MIVEGEQLINERKITVIPAKKVFKAYTNVAVYCRVSTPHDTQLESLEAQIDYYRDMVNKRVNYKLVDVYADNRSGRNISGRAEFQRMLADCYDGKIELIITKTISRFARNTLESLEILRKLNSLGIDVYFELEEIHTSDPKKELVYTLLEAFAQEQSESLSENIKWGIQKSLQNPESKLYHRKCFGYTKNHQNKLIIDADKSKVVHLIFKLYLQGYSIGGICKELESMKILTPTKKVKWSKRTIDTILSNEKYTGEVMFGKTFVADYFSNKRKANINNRQKFIVENSHPAIINKEVFDAVQSEKKRRTNVDDDNGIRQRKSIRYDSRKQSQNE